MYFEFSANEKTAMEVAATAAVSNLRIIYFYETCWNECCK